MIIIFLELNQSKNSLEFQIRITINCEIQWGNKFNQQSSNLNKVIINYLTKFTYLIMITIILICSFAKKVRERN